MKPNKIIILFCISLSLTITGCNSISNFEKSDSLAEVIQSSDENIKNIGEEIEILSEELQKEEIVQPVNGGTLNIAIRNPKTLNPLLNEDDSIDKVLKLIYDDLIILDKDQKPTSNIASSWSLSEDGLTLTLKLRDDVKWHNGSVLTASDVVFSINTIFKSQNTSAYKLCIDNIASYSKIDDFTVSIVYKRPSLSSIYSLTFPIICESYYKGSDVLTSKNNMAPMGTGAYEFYNFKTMKELNLKKNTNWFKGIPYIDNIKAIVIPKKEAELYAFTQGQIDVLNTDIVDWEKYDETKTSEYITNNYEFIGINFKNSILSDKLVRQAIAYSIPKDKIIEEIYLNHAVVVDVPVNPLSWLNYNKQLKYTENINMSKQILDQAGWTDSDQNGILDKEGKELRFYLTVNEDNYQRTQSAKLIQNSLKQIGIDMILDVQSYDTYVQNLTSKNFEAFIGGWKFSTIPDLNFAFNSSQIASGSNFISYSSVDMDNLLKQTISATTENGIKEAYKNLENYIIEELPYISLYFKNASVLTSKNVHVKGELTSNMGNIYSGIENWFIK